MYKRNNQIISRKFKEYLIPSIVSGMSIMLGAIVDGVIVGKSIGVDAMSAVGVSEPLVLFFQAVFFLIGIGGATLISISKGERDEEKANSVFTVGILAMLFISIIITVAGTLFLDPLVRILCVNQALYGFVKSYMRVLLLGTVFMVMVPGMVYFIRVDGMPKLSANILMTANAANLLLDLFFLNVLKMGIEGAALASVIGYGIGFVLVVIYWFSKERTLKLQRIGKEEWRYLSEIADGGMASAVNTCLLFVKTIIINRIVLTTVGKDGMAVFAVCNYAVSFVSMFISGAAETLTPLTGMLYGEKDVAGIKYVFRRAIQVVTFSCAAAILMMEFFPKQILMLFGIELQEQFAIGVPALRIFALSLGFMGISLILMNYMQATRHKHISVSITVMRGFAIVIPCAYVFSRTFGAVGIWSAFVAAELLTVVLTVLICKWTQMHSDGMYEGILLNERTPDQEYIYDITVQNEDLDVAKLSKALTEFSLEHGITKKQANLVGMMAEETSVFIAEHNPKNVEIDLLCRIGAGEIILNFRDDGGPLDPVQIKQEEEVRFSNIAVMKCIAEKVEYARVLGLNNTVVIMKKEKVQ